jgi:hypothetical protein
VLRRVHAPESAKDKKGEIKMFGRMLAKIAAANPLAVAQLVIAQVRCYSAVWTGLRQTAAACQRCIMLKCVPAPASRCCQRQHPDVKQHISQGNATELAAGCAWATVQPRRAQ